jgi:glycosyltransferase involved in cell wall biosynthesis
VEVAAGVQNYYLMRKTIFLNGRFLTQPITGVQRTAYELVKALDNLIEQNTIDRGNYSFQLIYSGTLINPIELKNIKLVKKGYLKGNLWEQLELPLYTFGHLLISMCTVSALFKRKQIVVVHDVSTLVNPSFFPLVLRLWYGIAIPALGKIAKHIVTVSNFSKNELVKHAGVKSEKITVIYNAPGHILNYEEPDALFKQKILRLKPYCLAVSSLGANKNFKGLSEAIGKIDFGKHNMLVAGGSVSTLQHAAPENAVITYLGYVSDEQLKFLYANAALFIFPSFYEGFGIPPLEAMISGCPVLSSNTSAMPEVLGDAAAYCNPADAEDMALKIDALINNSDALTELKAKGYQQAARYSWEDSAKMLFRLLKEML